MSLYSFKLLELLSYLYDAKKGERKNTLYLPITSNETTSEREGCVFTWHSNCPSSLSFTYFICNCQSLGGLNSMEYRESPLYVEAPIVIKWSCSPFLFSHDTYVRIQNNIKLYESLFILNFMLVLLKLLII